MNKLKGIILVVSICFASIMMPFNISADTITTANIIGTTVNLIDANTLNTIEQTTSGGTVTKTNVQYTYEVTVQLDNNYVGYLDLNIAGSYYTNLNSVSTSSFDYRRKVFINGNTCIFNFEITTWFASDPLLRNAVNGTPSVTLNDSGVTLISELDSIDQIINILNDLYNSNDQVEGLLNNQLTQLQQIVSNTSLANQYLDYISKLRQFNIPFESFSILYYPLNYYVTTDYFTYNYIKYPLFNIKNGQTITKFHMNTNSTKRVILLLNRNVYNIDTLNNFIGFESFVTANITIQNFKQIKVFYSNNFACLIYFEIVNSSNGIISINSKYDGLFTPIYESYLDDNNISTEFALQFGLNNKLLDNLDIIANGTEASDSASQQLDSDTSDFNTDRDDLIDIEDSMGNNMDSAMNQITPNNNGLSGFGGNFLTSAVWVRTQFERLTNNTPYGSLIVYGMTLGLALLLLGKVML